MIEFSTTKKIGNYLYLDEINQKWTIPQGLFKKTIDYNMIYSYSDITGFELLEDGNFVSKGGIGRAIIGGTLFGGVGAIIGGSTGHKNKKTCTRLQIKITLNNINNPSIYITFINSEVKKSSIIYTTSFNMAQEIISILQIICEQNAKKENNLIQNTYTSVDKIEEVKKYKQLLDCGAITEEEFNLKKKELLNL